MFLRFVVFRVSATTSPIVFEPAVATESKPSKAGKAAKAGEVKGKELHPVKGKGKDVKGKDGKDKGSASRATPRRASSSDGGTSGAAGAAGSSYHADEGEFMDQEGLDLQVMINMSHPWPCA